MQDYVTTYHIFDKPYVRKEAYYIYKITLQGLKTSFDRTKQHSFMFSYSMARARRWNKTISDSAARKILRARKPFLMSLSRFQARNASSKS